jgi:hypothetical protein
MLPLESLTLTINWLLVSMTLVVYALPVLKTPVVDLELQISLHTLGENSKYCFWVYHGLGEMIHKVKT